MVFFNRFAGIDSIAIDRVELIAVDYSALVPVSCGHVALRVIVSLATGKAAAGIVSGANIST